MTLSFRTGLTLALTLCLLSPALSQERVVLWDFETGIEGWWGNPWSGGKATVEATEGKFGRGLKGIWEQIGRWSGKQSPKQQQKVAKIKQLLGEV